MNRTDSDTDAKSDADSDANAEAADAVTLPVSPFDG